MQRQNVIKRLIDRKMKTGRNAKAFCVCFGSAAKARPKK